MKQYLELVDYVLKNGVRKSNRTGIDTLSVFGYFYKVDLQEGYPLLTTKKMYYKSMLHELLWYLSGKEHIQDLQKKTKIWDAWADEEGRLETAYGRFWRRFPVPEPKAMLEGENWIAKWTYMDPATGTPVFDQIRYIIDTLKEIRINPETANLRRLVVSAWHPGNAAESKLPPCHYTFCFNVSAGKLNCHLTQRSGDIALGIPFNLACYSLLTMMLAKECGFEPGEFAHTIVDAHVYVNHIDGLKEQMTRTPLALPKMAIADKAFFDLEFDDFKLRDYTSAGKISFEVAV